MGDKMPPVAITLVLENLCPLCRGSAFMISKEGFKEYNAITNDLPAPYPDI
jgi:hypothetical protein